MSKKFRLTKKQVIAGISVVVVIAAAVGFGILVRSLQQSGTGDNATSSEEALATGQKLPDLITEVQDLESAGKSEEATKKIDEALAKSETNNEMKYMLYVQKGNAAMNNGDVQAALTQYLKAYEASKTYESTRLVADTYRDLGDKQKAIEYYKIAYGLIPDDYTLAEPERENIKKTVTALGGSI
jgi:tetratricopeptide (TPR) repeat protein